MSWCRWGSPCWGTFPADLFKANEGCDPCPGSDLYIYDDGDAIVCCSCRLRPDPTDEFMGCADFRGTEEEMLDHIEEHVKAGHHVRPSLRRDASRELTERYRGTIWDVERAS